MSPAPIRIAYGDDAEQFGLLHLPEPGSGPDDRGRPVVVLVHGGFWRQRWRHDLMTGLADDLAGRGWAAWNLEYRRVGDPGGGFPGTLDDVAAGTGHLASLADEYHLDLDRVAVVGHSAGGHLALWIADPARGDEGVAVTPMLAIGQAPVVDLETAAADRLGSGAVIDFLGGTPDEVPDHYRRAQPALDPDRVVLIHGSADDEVPVGQSVAGAERWGCRAIVLDGVDHYQHIDPASPTWHRTVGELATALDPGER